VCGTVCLAMCRNMVAAGGVVRASVANEECLRSLPSAFPKFRICGQSMIAPQAMAWVAGSEPWAINWWSNRLAEGLGEFMLQLPTHAQILSLNCAPSP
jgi:hypothetical protein